MQPTAIFWPMIAHVALVYVVYLVLGRRRQLSVRGGEAKAAHFRQRGPEPATSATASANQMNQFELPILFHLVCLVLFLTAGISWATLTLAWIFVLSRYAHSWFHLTGNRVRLRFLAFAVGFVTLAILWIIFALHLLGMA
jgi:hypothetical protein